MSTEKQLAATDAIDLIRIRAAVALDSTDDDRPSAQDYFNLKAALHDILAIVAGVPTREED